MIISVFIAYQASSIRNKKKILKLVICISKKPIKTVLKKDKR